MRIFIFIFGLLFLIGTTFSQTPVQKGETQLNGGLGFSGWGVPIYVGLDYGIHSDISIGGELSYRSYHDNWAGGYDLSVIGILGNGNYHFNRILKISNPWDFYAGLNIGFYIWNSPSGYGGNHNSGLGLGVQVGGRYYFSKTFGINLEFGGGNTAAGGKIGVSIKL
jgi:outer membrane immunogenic protein